MKIIIIKLIFILLTVFLPLNLFGSEEYIVIIGHKTASNSLKKEDIKKIFLGKKTRWDNDLKIKFVILKDKKTYKKFLRKYVKKTLSQYRNYWKMKVFNGTGRMPISFKNQKDLIDYVSRTEGAIGFVYLKELDESMVKIIEIEQ
ncbi:PBP domain-containing protein [Candidatus Magnetomoraceae bacterium gMMP-15]